MFWPSWLAEDIPGLAVWTVDYAAKVSRWYGTGFHYTQSANSLLATILAARELRSGEVALIGHSYGGLVIKQILRTASDRMNHDSAAAEFLLRAHRVGFLGTPHFGSSCATALDAIRIFSLPSAATASLVRADPSLQELNGWYKHWSHENQILTLSLAEREGILKVLVVGRDSADPGVLSDSIVVDANHFSICKPASPESDVYGHVRDFLSQPHSGAHRTDRLEALLHDYGSRVDDLGKLARSAAADRISDPGGQHEELQRRLDRLRRSRFCVGYPRDLEAAALGRAILAGEWDGASKELLGQALAWCSRILSRSPESTLCAELNERASQFGETEELRIARAFVASAAGDFAGALTTLSSLRSPEALSATFLIRVHHEEGAAAIRWFKEGKLLQQDLDADGKLALVTQLLETEQWADAADCARDLEPDDYQACPALYHSGALATLALAVPEDRRLEILGYVPFDIRIFPLADDRSGMEARRAAQHLFAEAVVALRRLGCESAAAVSEDYSLWLQLMDPACTSAVEALKASMRDAGAGLRRVRFAMQFGVDVDRSVLDLEIEREWARSNGKSADAAIARLSLALSQSDPGDVAEYVLHHRSQLLVCFDPSKLNALEIEMLATAGRTERVGERLAQLGDAGIDEDEIDRLRKVAEAISSQNPDEFIRARYEESRKTADLAALVSALEERRKWERAAHYAHALFNETRTLHDGERAAHAIFQSHQFDKLEQFLTPLGELRQRSILLQRMWAWSLYHSGAFKESLAVLEALDSSQDHPNDRALLINIAISSGCWSRVDQIVEEEWQRRDDRSGEELIEIAQVAWVSGSRRVKELVATAVQKSPENPGVLVAAYRLATSCGWEDETTYQWIERAGRLSADDGPVRMVSLSEILALHPGWQQRSEQALKALHSAGIPYLGAARLLNKTLLEMFLLTALANREERDPRRRTAVLAFSGVRGAMPADIAAIGLDVTALLVLAMLNLLDAVKSAFPRIVVPHTTLRWLFDEKQRYAFHQPSRIHNAQQLRDLISIGVLRRFQPSASVDLKLAAEIGEDLAAMIAQSSADRRNGRQAYVIRSSPVHRLGSLAVDRVDMSSYHSVLRSCGIVVRKLRDRGLLTAPEEERARGLLANQEEDWPADAALDDGAVLYLDDLAVGYLRHSGCLEKLNGAGFEVFIPQRAVAEADALLAYQRLDVGALEIVERLRSFLEAEIESGDVRVGPMPSTPDEDDGAELQPLMATLDLVHLADVVVVDDHFFNTHPRIEHAGTTVPIVSTVELLDVLRARGTLSAAAVAEKRTELRRSQFARVPLSSSELQQELSSATVSSEGRLLETAELRAIRENVLCTRMVSDLKIPADLPWFTDLQVALAEALRHQWTTGQPIQSARAKSDWMVELLDARGWAHCLDLPGVQPFSFGRWGTQVLSLLLADSGLSRDMKKEYARWLDETVLSELRRELPQLHDGVLGGIERMIERIVSDALESSEAEGE